MRWSERLESIVLSEPVGAVLWFCAPWLPYVTLFAAATVPWAFVSPPRTSEFYDVAAQVMPVFLLVLLFELRTFGRDKPASGWLAFLDAIDIVKRSLRGGRPLLLTFYLVGEVAAFFGLAYGSSSAAFSLNVGPLSLLLVQVFLVGVRLTRSDDGSGKAPRRA